MIVGLFMAVLETTIGSVTLPHMQKASQADFKTLPWGDCAYFLAQAAVIPVVGYLSDRVGTKPIFLTSLILFPARSALCAFAPTQEALFAFPVFQRDRLVFLGPPMFYFRWRFHSIYTPPPLFYGEPILIAGGDPCTDWTIARFSANV